MPVKLIIQIPCYNEEETLPGTLQELPRQVEGVDEVEWLIINDGSTDRTVEVARENGVDHVVDFRRNQGLARGFMAGLDAAVKAGADIIVNTDADNQYCAADIPKLIAPVVAGEAEMVIGERPIARRKDFSLMKKALQKLGSYVVRLASGTDVPDATSGFRAISREAALKLNVFNEYTYTLETIIQAGRKGMGISSVPIRTNEYTRPSRLVRSIPSYVRRSMVTIFRISILYHPFRFFVRLGIPPFLFGFLLCVRWLVLTQWIDPMYDIPTSSSRAPSLVVAAIGILLGVQLWIFGLIADLMAANRLLLEDIQLQQRRSALLAVDHLPFAKDK